MHLIKLILSKGNVSLDFDHHADCTYNSIKVNCVGKPGSFVRRLYSRDNTKVNCIGKPNEDLDDLRSRDYLRLVGLIK